MLKILEREGLVRTEYKYRRVSGRRRKYLRNYRRNYRRKRRRKHRPTTSV